MILSLELLKQGDIENSLKCARDITLESHIGSNRIYTFKSLISEFVKQNRLPLSESTSFELPFQNDFQSCWKEIAKTQIEEKGGAIALETLSHVQNEEVRKYYLKGWAENVTIDDLTEELLLQALPLLKDDPESIEHLLQTHAINELFFGEATIEEIQKYNSTLNIQWAMDIKAQFPLE